MRETENNAGKTGETKTQKAGGKTFGGSGRKRSGPSGKPAGRPAAGKSFGHPEGKTAGATGGKAFGRTAGKPFGKPAGKPAGQMPGKTADGTEGMASRRIALRVLRQVTEEGAYASLALDKALTTSGLSGADRRLVSRLVYDTLDRLIYLDACLDQVMSRPDTDIKLRNILRLGACQILLEDRIPESAATNTAVQLCTETGMEGLKGVCNGILRNLVRRKDELVFPDPEKFPDEAASVRFSVPVWLWKKLKEEYGTEAESILSFRKEEEGWTLRRNLTRITEEEFGKLLEKKIWKKEKLPLRNAWRVFGAMDIGRDADFRNGLFSIQSPGSQMACLAMEPGRGKQLLDCCAAPGGKTCYLAEMMDNTGRIQAWDVHEHRVELISAQAKRLGLENIRPMVRDARKYREDLQDQMDGVLLDAPCSGTGMLKAKPDLKGRLTEEGLSELVKTQEELLETVSRYVKRNGILLYATCSILQEENEQQVERFLSRHEEFERDPLPDTIPAEYRKEGASSVQLLEHRDGSEGFYFCRMKRKK